MAFNGLSFSVEVQAKASTTPAASSSSGVNLGLAVGLPVACGVALVVLVLAMLFVRKRLREDSIALSSANFAYNNPIFNQRLEAASHAQPVADAGFGEPVATVIGPPTRSNTMLSPSGGQASVVRPAPFKLQGSTEAAGESAVDPRARPEPIRIRSGSGNSDEAGYMLDRRNTMFDKNEGLY